jgi:two-component system sensor histidine kinase CpxA
VRSFFLRIFVSFWAIIAITIVAAGTLGYFYAERARAAMQSFEVSDSMLEASEALKAGGRSGLSDWLKSLPGVTATLVYVIDERGNDLLLRDVPPAIRVAMRRFAGTPTRRRLHREPGNILPARPFTQLIGPDDAVYTLFVLPPRGLATRWLANRGAVVLIILALIVSATVSYLLARAISRPIRRFRESANRIAAGDFDTRATERVGRRQDEIGLLARDFDRMTDELRQAWQRQTELTRNVSHELRSPLARLRVALELARRRTGDLPELDRIDVETERVDELIGQILEYSRLDAAAHEASAAIDLDDLLRSVVEDIGFEFGEAGGDLAIEYRAEAGISMNGYAEALRSAVENVLRNAARHHRGSDAVIVELVREGPEAVISVEDSGGGVAEHELGRLFDPFYRAQAARREDAGEGAGLGLAIAARAVRLNGGSLSVSNAARGLLVEVRLPLAPTAV